MFSFLVILLPYINYGTMPGTLVIKFIGFSSLRASSRLSPLHKQQTMISFEFYIDFSELLPLLLNLCINTIGLNLWKNQYKQEWEGWLSFFLFQEFLEGHS